MTPTLEFFFFFCILCKFAYLSCLVGIRSYLVLFQWFAYVQVILLNSAWCHKIPNLSRKQRAFREPCSSFLHEPVRIIYSERCYKNKFQIYNHYLFFHHIHLTLKPHLDDLKSIKGQQFRLYSFDVVKFISVTAAVQGCSYYYFFFSKASLVLMLNWLDSRETRCWVLRQPPRYRYLERYAQRCHGRCHHLGHEQCKYSFVFLFF